MFDFCGAKLIDDLFVDDYFERVARAKKMTLQFLSALEGLIENEVYFEILRPENLRFNASGPSVHILDIPYIVESKEEHISLGYQNESSPPESLMELVFTPEKSMVWSVGLLLYRLLFKKYPFSGRIL